MKQLTPQDSGEISRLSAKMVELSLQDAQRDAHSRASVEGKPSPISSPSSSQLTDVAGRLEPPVERAAGPGMASAEMAVAPGTHLTPQVERSARQEFKIKSFPVLYSQAKVIVGEIRSRCGGFATGRKRMVGLTFAAHRAALLVRHWSRKLRARAPAVRVILRRPFALRNPYRCPDCGRGAGARSRPQNLAEQYILPLFLMQPVRCTACFHRDYRLIFTPVHHQSHSYSSSVGDRNQNAA
jgi:hypothetical protein